MQFNNLLSEISFDTFAEIIALSPRKVRESLYSHYGIKSKGSSLLSSLKEKKENRIKKLHERLQSASNPKELEFLKELIRNWLFNKRPMLKSALDFLEIENDNGLVEVETTFFTELDEETTKSLIKHLSKDFAKDEIFLYLAFMEVPHIEKHLA